MSRYLVQRLLLVLPTLIGVTLITFTLIRLVPGGTVSALLGPTATPEQAAALRHALGLDRPIWEQYVTWLGGLLHGDLGKSFLEQTSIARDLSQRIGWTLELGSLALTISLLVALPVGILAAVRQDSLWDYVARSAAIAFLAIPSFWLGTMLIVYGSMGLNLGGLSLEFTPPLGNEIGASLGQNLRLVLPPAIILGVSLSGSVMRLTRTQMLEVMRQDYIRTAQAKGIGEYRLILRHALRNAFIPIITIIGLQIPVLIGGSVVLEQIFSLPGVGLYLVNAISQRDLSVIQAIVLLSASVVIISNLAVDMAYAALDPRLRGVPL